MIQKGLIQTVTFHNPDNGYSVLKLSDSDTSKVFTAVGNFPRLGEGELLELEGDWVSHNIYGPQFRVNGFNILQPNTADSIEKYLSSGVFKGVGPSQAKHIVDAFGAETFHVLDHEPERLKEVAKIGPSKRANLLQQWQEKGSFREVMHFLQAHNLSLNLSRKLIEHYGHDAVKRLKANPYELTGEIWGIGFIKADDIAKKLGLKADSYERIRAGISYVLSRSAEDGHVFLERQALLQHSGQLLDTPSELIVYTLDHLTDDKDIVCEDNRYYRPYLYHSESGVAHRLLRIGRHSPAAISPEEIQIGITEAEKRFSSIFGSTFSYLPEQTQGISQAVNAGVFILTGGPGTGKTTTLLGILEIMHLRNMRIKLAAPTGRAAKRMSEVTGYKAATIHRMLQYDPQSGGFLKNEIDPLDSDVLVVDEVSMIDTVLMYSLLRAIKAGTHLIMVGDPDQLPSVGPGKVLSEIINSGTVPHLHLTNIVRQKEASAIITTAHRINQGQMPQMPQGPGDLAIYPRHNVEDAIETVVDLACRVLPAQGYNPWNDLQILTPMNKGNLGTIALNQKMQSVLNPREGGLKYKDIVFNTGDKVMQLKNNYDKNVFNGDIGIVEFADVKSKTLKVKFDDVVEYTAEDLGELNLAYVCTIHKSQGSEFRAVILLLTNSHYIMLQRNLFYTGLTRAREKLLLVGSPAAVSRAVQNNPAVMRNTMLAERLKAGAI